MAKYGETSRTSLVLWAKAFVASTVPAATAASLIIDKLNKEINAILADPKTKARLLALGAEPMSMTPAEFAKFIAEETEKWAKVVKLAHIKAR